MKTKKRKPTNKDFQRVIQRLGIDIMGLRAQIGAIADVLSNYLDFTGKRKEFEEFATKRAEEAIADDSNNPLGG